MKKSVFYILGILILGILYLWEANDQYWRGKIPLAFELGSTVHSNSDTQGITEACGVHVYELKKVTLDKITTEGIDFFHSAKQARGSHEYYDHYADWKSTPREDWNRYEDWSYELMCASMPDVLRDIIIDGGVNEGSFYAYGKEKVLMVIPSKKMIVLTHNG